MMLERLMPIVVVWTAIVLAASLSSAQETGFDVDALFDRLDANGDGQLTADGISDGQLPFFERMLRIGDKDGDGVLTRKEFVEALGGDRPGVDEDAESESPPRGPVRPLDLGLLFDRFDQNRDGKLTLDELPEGLRLQLRPMFERLGKDELTKEEFLGNLDGRPNRPPANEPQGNEPLGNLPNDVRPGTDEAVRIFQRLDADGDGKLTLDEAPEFAKDRIRDVFRRAGKGDGDFLTQEEFVQLTRPAAPQRPEARPQPETAQDTAERPRPDEDRFRGPRFFRLVDIDGDGKISREELAQALERFDELDLNKDGAIDLREFLGFPPGEGAPPAGRRGPVPSNESRRDGEMADRILQEADRNGDGKISKDEAPERLRQNFDRFDLNGDGQIDRDELIQGFERARLANGQPGR
jgi:Ca2+-binding EF-hand superfamily protein